MEKIWLLKEEPSSKIDSLSRDLGVSSTVAGILWRRGLHTLADARDFFNPDLNSMHDPFLMKGMETAVELVLDRLHQGKPILVFGDYDVDGTTASSMLHLFFEALGLHAEVYIPDRNREGYGVSPRGIDTAREHGIDLVITCDCGITAVKTAQYAREQGVDLIITDHHIPGDELPPARVILDPKQGDCEYPNKDLCGAGVAFKLAQAVAQAEGLDPGIAHQFLDLVAIGTAADIVPVTGENRIIVHEGLQLLADSGRAGLKALKEVAGMKKDTVNVADVVFGLAPRINAVGRLGEATRAVALLTTSDPSTARQLSQVLNTENEERKQIEARIFDEAVRMANAKHDPLVRKGLVLHKEGWHHGVIGIVASKLKERFWVPVVMVAVNDGLGKSSARSLEGFDMYSALAECSELLESFGGHTMAAGMTIKPENLESFEEKFLQITNDQITEQMMRPRVKIEAEIDFLEINLQLMETLRRLAPYGPGNMRPIFASRELMPTGHPRIVGKDHLKFRVKQGKRVLDAIGFGMAEYYELLISGRAVDCAYVLTENEWQGRKSIQLEVKDLRLSEN